MGLKPNSQNQRLIDALRAHPAGLTALQLSRLIGSTAVATRASECRKHGFKIKNLTRPKGHPVYILYEG